LHHTSIQNGREDYRLVYRRQQPVVDDHTRRKVFGNKHAASAVCHELRSLCRRNAKVFEIDIAQDGDVVAADISSSASQK
jgi:hypothetical protein